MSLCARGALGPAAGAGVLALPGGVLAPAVGDTALAEIVGGDLHGHSVAAGYSAAPMK